MNFTKHLIFKIILSIFILVLILCMYRKYHYDISKKRENFFSKVDLNKKVIVVIMDKVIPSQVYSAMSDHACNKLVNDCTIDYDKDKANTKNKINVTNDISFKTSSKKKDVAYIVIYKNNKKDKYNKKFMKKWCSDKKKEKDNYVIIDYDNALMNSHQIMEEIASKLEIKFDVSDLMKLKL
jgi:hypothetical protein